MSVVPGVAARLRVCAMAAGIGLSINVLPAHAQAWAPPARTGSISLLYQAIAHDGHRLTDGTLLRVGRSRTAGVYVEGDYAFTDRLSMSVGLPYVFARYVGPDPAVGARAVDLCGCWNHALQDVNATARFNVLNGAFALTPSVGVVLPSHAYEYKGEAVVGRDLKEVRVGIDVGQRLDALSPRVSLTARYTYAVVERVLDVPNNRSNGSIDAAVALSRKASARVSYAWQRTHGGLRAGTGPPPPIAPLPWGEIATPALFEQHDRLLRDNYVGAGASVAYSFERLDVFAAYRSHFGGTDTHAVRAVTVGVSWPFEIGR